MTDSRLIRLRPDEMDAGDWLRALKTMGHVIGALMMRELHTRYGRENVGYLWLFLEPMTLGSVIGLLHMHAGGSELAPDITPIAFTVAGYCNFIMFRGVVNRSEGALEANAPLLYHRQVSVLDIVMAKALLEAAGTFMSYTFLMSILILVGLASPPVRPLYVFAGIGYIFWFSTALSMLVMAGAYEIRSLERMVHVLTYFMIPLSGAFFMISWIPPSFRNWLIWNPFPSMFEMIRYGQFRSASPDYIYFEYCTGCCLVLTFVGLVAVKGVRKRVHLH
jgi:capsular polysaccharide transport system permease protein